MIHLHEAMTMQQKLFVICALSLTALFSHFCSAAPPLRISKETTYVTGPLTADGKYVDYFAALEEKAYPPEMKTDDNGYRLVVKALGALKEWGTDEEKAQYHCLVCEKLGLDPDVPPTLYAELNDWSATHFIDEETKRQHEEALKTNPDAVSDYEFQNTFYSKPWTLEEFPFMEGWLEKANPALDILAEALRKPAFRIPYIRENEDASLISALPLDDIRTTRDWARSFSVRYQYRLGIGDIDGAIDDILSMHRLGRHVGQDGMFIQSLLGLAIEGVGIAQGIASNPKFPPTKEQLERLFSELKKLDGELPRGSMEKAFEMERLFCLGMCQDLLWGKLKDESDGPININPVGWQLLFDTSLLFQRFNEGFDAWIAGTLTVEDLVVEPHWTDVIRLISEEARTKMLADQLLALLLPATEAAREAFRRADCTANVQKLTLALLLYEKEHGSLPDGDWREAILPYLGEHPERYFRCPAHGNLAADETCYVLIEGALVDGRQGFLITETIVPQKMGEGTGRLPREKAKLWQLAEGKQSWEPEPPDFDGIGSFHPGIVTVGLRSGAAQAINKTMPSEELNKMIDGVE